MLTLAIDTCFDGCSVAVLGPTGVLAKRLETMSRGHAERLPVLFDEVMREADIKPVALTHVVVTRGPGTFTGLRIGLSYAKGLGLALSIPVFGLDSLTAVAVPHRGRSQRILVSHAAGGTGMFYAALFDGHSLDFHQDPALIDADTRQRWAKDALHLENQVPDAALFGADGLALQNQDMQPLYLRAADAKPSAPAHLSAVTVRPAELSDIPVLAKLHESSFDAKWTEEMLQSSLSLAGSGALIVELAHQSYGFVQYQWVAGEAEINTLCVLPNYRRQGFARALLLGLVDHLKRHATTKLHLEVAADNDAALALYRQHGFRENGRREGYYARPARVVDALMMVRDL